MAGKLVAMEEHISWLTSIDRDRFLTPAVDTSMTATNKKWQLVAFLTLVSAWEERLNPAGVKSLIFSLSRLLLNMR